MRIVPRINGYQSRSILIGHHRAGIHKNAAAFPWPKRCIAKGITQRRSGPANSIFRAGGSAVNPHIFIADFTYGRRFKEAERGRVLTREEIGIISRVTFTTGLCTGSSSTGSYGGNKAVNRLGSGSQRIHGVLIQLACRRGLESPVSVSSETDSKIRIAFISNVLNIYCRVESHSTSLDGSRSVRGHIDRCKWPIRTIALGNHGFSVPAPAVRVQVVFPFAVFSIELNKVRSIHHVPLILDIVGENRPLITPARQVLDRCRPRPDIRAAITVRPDIVRSNNIDAIFSRIIGVLKNTGFSVGQMFP